MYCVFFSKYGQNVEIQRMFRALAKQLSLSYLAYLPFPAVSNLLRIRCEQHLGKKMPVSLSN